MNLNELQLSSSFCKAFGQVIGGRGEGKDHFAGTLVIELTGGDAVDYHGQSLLDGMSVAERVQNLRAQARAGVDVGSAGSAKLLVRVAKGAAGDRRRLATAPIGFGVTASGESRYVDAHVKAP